MDGLFAIWFRRNLQDFIIRASLQDSRLVNITRALSDAAVEFVHWCRLIIKSSQCFSKSRAFRWVSTGKLSLSVGLLCMLIFPDLGSINMV